MKIAVTKTVRCVIDTAAERERIRAFAGDPETRRRLNRLMDAIEALQWEEAWDMLCNKWWRGRDKDGTPRIEFVGLLFQHPAPHGFDDDASYEELVRSFIFHPGCYRAAVLAGSVMR